LGEFLATFAQPPIIGLAYNYRLELFITNAADQDFRQQYSSNMLLYSNQPNSSVIFKNLEYYEKEFEKEFLISGNGIDGPKSMRSLSVPNTSVVKLSPTSSSAADGIVTKKVNIETYLLSIIKANHFNDRMNTSGGRLSSTTASESDECELFSITSSTNPTSILKRLSSTTDDLKETDGQRHDQDNNNAYDDPFSKFIKFNTPFKNNFINSRVLTPEAGESHSFVWHMGFGVNSENDGVLHNYDYIFKENGSGETEDDDDDDEQDDLITDFDNNLNKSLVKSYPEELQNGDSSALDDSFEKKLNNLTLRDKLNNNCEVEDSELEEYNSHQYWYIEPPTIEELEELNNNNNNNSSKSVAEEEEQQQQPEKVMPEEEEEENNLSGSHDQSTIIMDEDNESNDSMKVNYPKIGSQASKLQIFNETNAEEETTTAAKNDSDEVEWNLIEDFVFMKDIDNNLCYKCAFNFPAVMLTLGKQFWPLMHQHFLSLCNDLQSSVRVRKTMAKSIYQIALIVGHEQATKDLVAPFVEFFKDIDEIKIEVVKQVANFIKIVDPSKHEIIVNQLEMCWMPSINVINWRLREQIGIQIVELNKIGQRIQKENCILYLTGLALKLMMDKYDCVRQVGIDAFVSCVEKIKQKKQLLKFLSFHFANSTRWRERQVYVLTADKLLERRAIKPELFNNYVLKKLIELVADKIPNIRLCVAKCLSNTLMENRKFCCCFSSMASC